MGERKVANSFVQTMATADADAISLSKFVNGTEAETVPRRLNTTIKTLSFYISNILSKNAEIDALALDAKAHFTSVRSDFDTVSTSAKTGIDTAKSTALTELSATSTAAKSDVNAAAATAKGTITTTKNEVSEAAVAAKSQIVVVKDSVAATGESTKTHIEGVKTSVDNLSLATQRSIANTNTEIDGFFDDSKLLIKTINNNLKSLYNTSSARAASTDAIITDTFNKLSVIPKIATSNKGTVTINGVTQKTVGQMVYEAMDASVLPDGEVTDTVVVATAKYVGSKARTQASKNSDTINVDDFIQDINDPTTHTAGFQAAHDYLYALGGGTVHLNPRKYYIQGVEFGRGVRWLGAGTDSTIIKPTANPVAGLGLFTVVGDEPKSLTGIGFYEMTIEGDATASGYRPVGATAKGIDFGTNVSDAEINQCYFVNVFFSLCTIGLNMVRSVRFAPIIGCRFWTNELGLFIGNEHPVLVNNDFRYNNVGMDGICQDMDLTNTRFSYNRVGCQVEMSRSTLVNCKFWQNEVSGITNLREYCILTGCLFRGAGTFWKNVNGTNNESNMVGLSSRGTRISDSFFYGGNGLARPMIEFSSIYDQHSFNIVDNLFIVDSGHVIGKVGTGDISGLRVSDNSFLVTSTGDNAGAMGIRIPDNKGIVSETIFRDNYIRNQDASQTYEFVENPQVAAGGNIVKGNLFHNVSGRSGGVYFEDTSDSIFKDNIFRGTKFLSKIKILNMRKGLVIKDNIGFRTERNGEVSILRTETSVVVTHGLDAVALRSCLSVTPYLDMGDANKFWVSDFNNTNFTINVDVPPRITGATFMWTVNAHKFNLYD